MTMRDARIALAATCCGGLFGLGLSVARMTDPGKVLAFLDVGALPSGGWDPSLALVLVAAVGTNLIGHRLVMRRPHPILAKRFHLPDLTEVDRRLVLGALLFGIGWGMAGYCPGPALAALPRGGIDAALFTIAMLAGMYAFQRLQPGTGTPKPPASGDAPRAA